MCVCVCIYIVVYSSIAWQLCPSFGLVFFCQISRGNGDAVARRRPR